MDETPNIADAPDEARARQVRRSFETAIGIPFQAGNTIDALRNGDEIFPAMLDAIDGATHFIEFLTFVYWTGTIAERFAVALAARAKAGVKVHVILDGYGAYKMPRHLVTLMKDAGVLVQWFRPLRFPYLSNINHRTHRKILVVDGTVGFTGGVGIAKEWEGDARGPGEWRDTHFRIRGPVVNSLRAAFLGNWYEIDRGLPTPSPQGDVDRTGTVLVQTISASASIGWSDIATVIDTAIRSARRNIRIAAAYFAPDQATVNALCDAAGRGISVDVILPGEHIDHRASQLAGENVFADLLACGIKLWSYERTMIHAKIMLVDDALCCIGTANFNQRSLRRDDEVALVILDRDLMNTLRGHYEDDLTQCVAITRSKWAKRSLWQRMQEVLIWPFRRNV